MTQKQPRVLRRTAGLPDEHKLQMQFALAAFRCLDADKIAYISAPITSGSRLYAYLDEKNFATIEEAKADRNAFFENVVAPNIRSAVSAGDNWTQQNGGAAIAPAKFEKGLRTRRTIGWGQDEYMGMWLSLIDDKITHMVMVDGWEYSNGSGEEYLEAVLMQMGRRKRSNISIADIDGKEIALDEGVQKLAKAFKDIHARGLKARNLAEILATLLEAEERYDTEHRLGRSTEPAGETADTQGRLPAYNHSGIVTIRQDLKAIFEKDYPDIQPRLEAISSFDYSPMNKLFPAPEKIQRK